MRHSNRFLVYAILLMLLIAVMPLWARGAVLPCLYRRPMYIGYGYPMSRVLTPDDRFRYFPPLCMDVEEPWHWVL